MDYKWLMDTSIPVLFVNNNNDEHTVEAVNKSFMRLIGVDIPYLTGRTIQDVIDEHIHLGWLKKYESTELALIAIGEQWFEIEVLTNDGIAAYIHHNLTAQVDIDNTNKRLQTRINQIQRLALIGDWEHDFAAGEEFWSDEVYRMLGFKDKAIQPNVDTFMRFIHPEDIDKVNKAHEAIPLGNSYEVEYRIITIEGQMKWIVTRANVEMGPDGTPSRLYGTMQDITERRKLEQRVEKAFGVAEDAHQSKSQFLAMISHEIRTPINGIMGMAQLMKNTVMDEEQSEFVDDILFSSDALLNIIEDILEMSKMDSDLLKADSEEFDLHILIRNIVRMNQLKKQDKPVRFIHRIDPKIPQHVLGDATKIQQILVNLLGNAFKFTEEGRVSFSIKVLEDDVDKSKIAFEVEDTGIGISQNMQKEIFASYVQGEIDTQKKYGGTGLGLSISKNYSELMGGYLFVESELGHGTKFTFAITLKKSKSLDIKTDNSALYSRMKAMHVRVLVVEDDEINKNYYRGLLQNVCGFKVDFADSLNTVIHALEHHKYQFVIMDTHLKNESGIYITRTIRESMKLDGLKLPIIAMTADVRYENREAFMAAGVSYFMEKPVDEATFLDVIHQILDMNVLRKSNKPKLGYRYINPSKLGETRIRWGRQDFDGKVVTTVDHHPKKVASILAAVEPLNILILSHEINEIDDIISNFGTDDICESMELIKSALLNDDTAGIDVIVTDFMDEYQCFVNELQDFMNDLPVEFKKS